MRSKFVDYLGDIPIATWIVLLFFLFFSWKVDWRVIVLLFPIYWQVYLKKGFFRERGVFRG